MNLHNNNKLAEQLMPLATRKVGALNLHNNSKLAEQQIPLTNNREGIQMGHCLKWPYSVILIAQITWKVWNYTH